MDAIDGDASSQPIYQQQWLVYVRLHIAILFESPSMTASKTLCLSRGDDKMKRKWTAGDVQKNGEDWLENQCKKEKKWNSKNNKGAGLNGEYQAPAPMQYPDNPIDDIPKPILPKPILPESDMTKSENSKPEPSQEQKDPEKL
ncbi:uncharacterized protein KY384_003605 [Bacidia gigantensis]|uniref:uncharacterized protein n=1 Tax=Bacidia gigantensis TaxID=2732470 RepID=UPI001D05863C|nr:uncharacterized protein KY384_003605 [Bacidia gigantensis]KAG8531969.1 hypothetical protein KY384_003605 [Bacidia gigantensis]